MRSIDSEINFRLFATLPLQRSFTSPTESAPVQAVRQTTMDGIVGFNGPAHQREREMDFAGGFEMKVVEDQLKALITKGKDQGYLTYAEVGQFLPDEAASAERLDSLIAALEGSGIELVQNAPGGPSAAELARAEADSEPEPLRYSGRLPRPSDDPIRMYPVSYTHLTLPTKA